MGDRREYWYGGQRKQRAEKITVQRLEGRRYERPELPEPIVAMAEAEYERQGFGQTSADLRRRGGLGYGEVVSLLADAVERYAPERALRPSSEVSDG